LTPLSTPSYPCQVTQFTGREAGIQSPNHTIKCAFGAASNTIDWLMFLLIDLSFPSRPLRIGVLRLSIGSIARPGTINHRDSPAVTIKGISHALKPVPKSMWERRKWTSRSQSLSDDRYGSSDGTPKKRGFECEKRLNARGSRDTGEALRPVSSAATAIATLI